LGNKQIRHCEKKTMKIMKTILTPSLALAIATSAFAQDLHVVEKDYKGPKQEYSPYLEDHFPDQVYFGDTHLHTSWSTDAGMVGATVGPGDAFFNVRLGRS
jgi:hypothetical protein